MGVKGIWRRLSVLPRLGLGRGTRPIHSARELRVIIDRERTRCDRNCHYFSLVLVDLGSVEARDPSVQGLTGVLAQRIRCTDDLGWFDGRRLGVVLPDTPNDGAWRFVGDVREKIAGGDGPSPGFAVYTYPSHRVPGSDGNGNGAGGRQLTFGDVAPDKTAWILGRPEGPSPFGPDLGGRLRRPAPSGAADREPLPADAASLPAAEEPPEDSPGDRSAQKIDVLGFVSRRRLPLWKRVMDCAGAALLILAWSPAFAALAAWIKVVSPGPIFFRQKRIGISGRPFVCWKFRTMKPDAETSSHQTYVRDLIQRGDAKAMTKLDHCDPRIIPLGRIIRKAGIDELPQLLNVVRGEMSLVGPRPCLPTEYEEYRLWQTRRCDAVPGLTGLWQVSGKNRTTFHQMMRLDIKYARRLSFWLDVKILLRTVPAVIGQIRQ